MSERNALTHRLLPVLDEAVGRGSLTIAEVFEILDLVGPKVPTVTLDDINAMCPNCVTPWKCNGPHEPADHYGRGGVL